MCGSALGEDEKMRQLSKTSKTLFFPAVCSCLPFLIATLILGFIPAKRQRAILTCPPKSTARLLSGVLNLVFPSTTLFQPKSFTYHMKAEHGELKGLRCTEHEACRRKNQKGSTTHLILEYISFRSSVTR